MQPAGTYCFAKRVTLEAKVAGDFGEIQPSVELLLGLGEDWWRENGRSS
jgi:hypothetical protein